MLCGRPGPGWQGEGMLRHVVPFTWSADADDERRDQTLAALRRLPDEVGGMTSFAVGPDAGLADGNAHTALVADFPDVEAWRRYATDPRHLEVIAEHVRPFLAARSAVQYEV
jgi:hypothetical protein